MRDRRNTSLSLSSITPGSRRSTFSEKRSLSLPPLPSPRLPAPVTKENVSIPNARPRWRMAVRLLAITCALVAAFHFLCRPVTPFLLEALQHHQNYESFPPNPSYAFLAQPSAISVTDQRGQTRWTVSMPGNQSFPLTSTQRRNICEAGGLLRDRISQESRLLRAQDWRRKGGYYACDSTFLEVDEAESTGLLPPANTDQPGPVCTKSLTFVLDSDDSSFGKSLLLLWLSYGLAKKEGRSFFIDDTRWAYGRYASFFAPPPSTGCFPPPLRQVVPCPRSARHLLVSSATAPWTFGPAFEKEFSSSRQHVFHNGHRIYDLLRKGYEDLFVMKGEDALYAASRLAKFQDDARQHATAVIGIHVRRGDLHPHEYQYSEDYLPIERYAAASRQMLSSPLHKSPADGHGQDDLHKFDEHVNSAVLLGSDDPEVFESPELSEAASPFAVQKAQERIQLATKATLDVTSPAEPLREPGSAYVKHIDENSGWEGGFYSSLFFGLGRKKDSGPSEAAVNAPLSEETRQMRELVGRAYLLDLAVLGESDGVVCAVSSATCRVLGVMMGWDAIAEGRWMNVDDNRPWSWR